MRRWQRGVLLLGLLLMGLTWPSVVQAHFGAPYPVLLEQTVGPYTVSALADPDVGIGTFIIEATLSGTEPLPSGTVVVLWVRPEDDHIAEASYQAQRQEERFIAKVPFDAEGMWGVRLVVDGVAGRGEVAFRVLVTPPGPRWATTLICLLPFVALGGLWVIGALRQRQASTPAEHKSGGE